MLGAYDSAVLYLYLEDNAYRRLEEYILAGEEVDAADCYLVVQEVLSTADPQYINCHWRQWMLDAMLKEYDLSMQDLMDGTTAYAS